MKKRPTQQPLPLKAYYAPRVRGKLPDFKLTYEHLLARGFFLVSTKGPYSCWQRYVDFSINTEQIETLAIGTVFSLVSRQPGEDHETICFQGWPASLEDIDFIFRLLRWHPGPNITS